MILKPLIVVVLTLPFNLACADQSAAPKEPSVEENIQAMDKDHDGVVSVYEVRAYIEAKHGKGYKKDVLDEMESSASGKSCKTPFSNSIY